MGRDALTIREQGGLLIEWTASAAADLVVKSATTEAAIALHVTDLLVRRHAPLFVRNSAGPARPASPERLVEA